MVGYPTSLIDIPVVEMVVRTWNKLKNRKANN
jgi:hypothetical protein